MPFFHEINHAYRDYLAENIIHNESPPKGIDDFIAGEKALVHSVAANMADIFSLLARHRCVVTVKLCKSQKNKDYCYTYTRSETNSPRDRERNRVFEIDPDKNTGFYEARTRQNKAEYYRYFCNDLNKAVADQHYKNERAAFLGYYQSAIVVPIRFTPEQDFKTEKKQHKELGFLCVDCGSRNVFDEEVHVPLLAAFADQMYNFINLSRARTLAIAEAATMQK